MKKTIFLKNTLLICILLNIVANFGLKMQKFIMIIKNKKKMVNENYLRMKIKNIEIKMQKSN